MTELPIKRLFVENWTEADFAEDARRQKLLTDCAKKRRSTMEGFGWKFHDRYCSRDVDYVWDPVTGEKVSFKEAYRREEARNPGCIPEWPDLGDYKFPPSTMPRFDIKEGMEIKPLNVPAGSIFYLDYQYGKTPK